ncbi:sulfatase family protein [Halalkalibacter okhensis]|uniref:Sulfatase N-terminal domain-containing protein n=1 Tax=Halalkalibacter okhensis TaxID=333138 RepID=A0A0B0IKH1_9BACI|nr:sulfatase-like hydrolase/transferase [Halalkalibacter okhensis]KHF40559.1 hypothetical protein LQ50_08510 [Halalkalibacter okhensis]
MTRKNILFITTDQQRADAIGSETNYFTPNLEKLAKMGVQFSKHVVTSAQCTPSRASWMTGRYPHEVGVNIIGHMLDPKDENIAEVLNRGGYETAYFGKWHLGGHPSDYGFQVTTYRTEGVDLTGTNDHPDYHSNRDAHSTAEALNYLNDYDNDKSFFMHLSWYMPHPNQPTFIKRKPFEDVPAYDDQYKVDEMPVPKSFYEDDLSSKPPHQKRRAESTESKLTETIIREDAKRYRKLVSLMDRNLGKIIEKLEEKGILHDTMIVFTSDHGDMQGAHRLRLKGVLPYRDLYEVPLLVYLPWVTSKRKEISDVTSSASLAGTMIDAVGLPVPTNFYESLLPLLKKEEADPDTYVFIEHYKAYWGEHPFRGIQTGQFKYVYYYQDDKEEMYDLVKDPDELQNIYDLQPYQSTKKELKELVEDWWEKTGGLSKQPIIDERSEWNKAVK